MRKRKKIAVICSISLFVAVLVVLVCLSLCQIEQQNQILQRKLDEIDLLKLQLMKADQKYTKLMEDYGRLQKINKEMQAKIDELEKQVEQERANQWQSFVATYYDAGYQSTGKRPGDAGYGITKSGRYVTEGVTVAVDPEVIPLGSWIEILYPNGKVEQRRADDTGRLIKGNKIDIYLPKVTEEYGVDQVMVRLIQEPTAAV